MIYIHFPIIYIFRTMSKHSVSIDKNKIYMVMSNSVSSQVLLAHYIENAQVFIFPGQIL